jgi:cytosine/adenosine deaminase-related metal-dependent hydrolase
VTPLLLPDLPRRIATTPARQIRLQVAAAADATRLVRPATVLLDASGPVTVDRPEAVGHLHTPVIELPGVVVLPPLVNAHAHLDLTGVGPMDPTTDFAQWAGQVRQRRPETPQAITAAVQEGVRRSVAGGTGFIGDIAGNFGVTAVDALRSVASDAGIEGVSYVEVFGIGHASDRGARFLRGLLDQVASRGDGICLGVSPHAPYSCDDTIYAIAAELGLPLTTHLSETLEELQFVRHGTGPFANLLKSVGAWTPELRGWGAAPIQRLLPLLASAHASLVHLNYLDAASMEMLAATVGRDRTPVPVYCPRASAWFGHPQAGHAPHAYRAMLDAGLPVALGTDSAIVLGDSPTISVLDEMRLLQRRDGTDARQLLTMATVHGARALQLDPARVTLPTGRNAACADLWSVDLGDAGHDGTQDPLERVLESRTPGAWLWRAGGRTRR